MSLVQGEFTGSGTVDINDLTIVLANYGQTAGAAGALTAVPEPSGVVLIVIGLVGLLWSAWRGGCDRTASLWGAELIDGSTQS